MTHRLCIHPKDYAAWSEMVRSIVEERATEILRDHASDLKEAHVLFETFLRAAWPLNAFERGPRRPM